jgi:hypothetical protein
LRRAAAELFFKSPEFVRDEVDELIRDFSELFPEAFARDDQSNQAEGSERPIRSIIDDLNKQGYTKVYGEEISPPGSYQPKTIGGIILNGLFFRADHTEGENFWLNGTRLIRLVDWLDRLLDVFSIVARENMLTETMARLQQVILIYSISCNTALRHNLDIGISW